MLKYLKIGVSTLALSAFVLAPAVTVITADYAYAKNDNGNNGNGGNKGGNGGGSKGAGGDKGKSSDAKGGKAKGKGADKQHGYAASKARNPNRGTVKGDLKKLGNSIKSGFGLFGKKDKAVATKSQGAKPSKQASAKVKDAMHPSNLGKMNGLLNSSINAKLAHIANGQYTKGTGPVSLAARFAVAEYKVGLTEDAVETLAMSESISEALTALDGLSVTDVQDAQAAVEGLTYEDIQTAQEIVDGTVEGDIVAAQQTLDDKAIADAQATVDAAVAEKALDEETGEFTDDFASEVSEAEAIAADALADTDETDPLAAAVAKADAAEADALSTYKGDFETLETVDQERVRAALRETVGAEYVDAETGETVEADAETTAAVADALERYEAKSAENVEESGEDSAMVDDAADATDEG